MILFVFLLLYSSYSFFNGTVEEVREFFAYELRDKVLREAGIAAVAISIVKDGAVFFNTTLGYEDPFSKPPVPVSIDKTVFGIGGISQVFPAVAIVQNIHNGNSLADVLSANVNKFLPADVHVQNKIIGNYDSQGGRPVVPTSSHITVGNLLTHTAGFDYRTIPPSIKYNLHEDLRKNMPPRIRETDVVGVESAYGISMGALMVGTVNGGYEQSIQKKIFDALDMKSSYYRFERAKKDSHLCKRTYREGNRSRIHYPQDLSVTAQPANAIYSTHGDMQKFIIDLLSGAKKLNFSSQEHETFISQHFAVGSVLPGIDLAFVERDEYGVRWKGLHGKIGPFVSSLQMNFPEKLGVFMTFSASSYAIREQILRRFSLRFMQRSDYCAKQGGEMSTKGDCVVTTKLSDIIKIDKHHEEENFYEERYKDVVGCYVEARRVHTSFEKIISDMFFSRPWCIDLYRGRYLSLKADPFDKKSGVSHLFLEHNISQSSSTTSSNDNNNIMNFLQVKLKRNGSVEYIANPTSSQYIVWKRDASAKKDENPRKYLIVGSILATKEYMGDYSLFYFSYYITWVAVAAVPILVLLFTAISLICIISNSCSCCCFGCFDLFDKEKGEKYYGFEEEMAPIMSVNDGDYDRNSLKAKLDIGDLGYFDGDGPPKQCWIGFCTHANHWFFTLLFVFLSLAVAFSFAHYVLAFVATFIEEYVYRKYPTTIVVVSYFCPMAAYFCVFLSVLAALMMCISTLVTCSFQRKKVNIFGRYTFLCICVCSFPLVAAVFVFLGLYYWFSYYYNFLFYFEFPL